MDPSESRYSRQVKIVAFIAILIFGIFSYKENQKVSRLNRQIEGLQNTVADYENALDEANNNIEDANSNIEGAKSNAWASYEDMGDALDSLSTVETVNTP